MCHARAESKALLQLPAKCRAQASYVDGFQNKNRSYRYQSAREVAVDLRRLSQSQTVSMRSFRPDNTGIYDSRFGKNSRIRNLQHFERGHQHGPVPDCVLLFPLPPRVALKSLAGISNRLMMS